MHSGSKIGLLQAQPARVGFVNGERPLPQNPPAGLRRRLCLGAHICRAAVSTPVAGALRLCGTR